MISGMHNKITYIKGQEKYLQVSAKDEGEFSYTDHNNTPTNQHVGRVKSTLSIEMRVVDRTYPNEPTNGVCLDIWIDETTQIANGNQRTTSKSVVLPPEVVEHLYEQLSKARKQMVENAIRNIKQ